MENADIKYLKVLATQYPNIAAAATEIGNLKSAESHRAFYYRRSRGI